MSIRLTVLALLVGSAPCAWAQDSLNLPSSTVTASRQSAPSGVSLDQPIHTGSRLGLSARQTPASVSVASRAVIEARGARDSHEVLNGMSGINASANPGYGSFIAYRGFTQSQITQLFNGINLGYGSAARPIDAWIGAAPLCTDGPGFAEPGPRPDHGRVAGHLPAVVDDRSGAAPRTDDGEEQRSAPGPGGPEYPVARSTPRTWVST